MSDAGTQQLLLDTNALKTLLLSLPVIGLQKSKTGGGAGDKKAAPSYVKLVTAESAKLEVLLKVLLSPPEEVQRPLLTHWTQGKSHPFMEKRYYWCARVVCCIDSHPHHAIRWSTTTVQWSRAGVCSSSSASWK